MQRGAQPAAPMVGSQCSWMASPRGDFETSLLSLSRVSTWSVPVGFGSNSNGDLAISQLTVPALACDIIIMHCCDWCSHGSSICCVSPRKTPAARALSMAWFGLPGGHFKARSKGTDVINPLSPPGLELCTRYAPGSMPPIFRSHHGIW